MRPERMAGLILTVLLMLSAAGLTALAVAFTSQLPTPAIASR
jgi:hypothetical protein